MHGISSGFKGASFESLIQLTTTWTVFLGLPLMVLAYVVQGKIGLLQFPDDYLACLFFFFLFSITLTHSFLLYFPSCII